jgi:hypothetical protein
MIAAFGFDLIKVPRMFGREHDGMLCLLTSEAWSSNKFNQRLKHHIEPRMEEAA